MTDSSASIGDRIVRFCLENKLVVTLVTLLVVSWGILVAPFDWQIEGVPRDPVPVDAIPDTGENQQIVFTNWAGRSPQDIEDQVTYPLTVALLNVPGVKTIRSNSVFGFSSVFVIFDDDVEFYWSRTRILEKLNSLPAGTLPDGVQPSLGPDATPLGQVFWYTLEGRDPEGRPAGGWDLHTLRSIQDWHIRYALSSVEGVAEVASIGGHVAEYQVDVDPDAMRAHRVTLEEVFRAVKGSNAEVGARTIEINRVEYVIRGLGFIKQLRDIEDTVVAVRDNVPVTIRQIATVGRGPALRRGVLDKGGAEAVGGAVVVRYGANPLAVIQGVKAKIAEISGGLPQKTLADGTISRVTIEPFYDRTGLIEETLATLNDALVDEILVTIIVVLVLVAHVRSAILIAGLLPLAVLICFIAMKVFRVDANIVALSGIAIAIGTMVDMGIVIAENILGHLEPGQSRKQRLTAILKATSEVRGAVLTAVLTTVVSFLPVFTMEGAEGKLFKPLAYTKTFALLASIAVAIVVIPPVAHAILGGRSRMLEALRARLPDRPVRWTSLAFHYVLAGAVALVLATTWQPLGPTQTVGNIAFTVLILAGCLLFFYLFLQAYEQLLRICLRFKALFLMLPTGLVLAGAVVWFGFGTVFSFVPESLRPERAWSRAAHAFPGLGSEFMPSLDEGSFLLMPITMYHTSITEATELLQLQDRRIGAIPEVASVVGKIGRADSPLDPAPVGMVETVINYKSEYLVDAKGHPRLFAYDAEEGDYERTTDGRLIEDEDGRPYRQWRDHIRNPGDIWKEIEVAAAVPGMTTASMLQPIETRRIMLQTGMRAKFGLKVYGPDLATVERVGLQFEKMLKRVPQVRPATVIADRVVGKPYLEIDIDRQSIARYGLTIRQIHDVIEVAIGGRVLTHTIEGRERYPVRVRYPRERRDRIESIERILVPTQAGAQIPLGQLAKVRYTPGPQTIKSEDTFPVSYVIFDGQPGIAEVDVVEACEQFLKAEIDAGRFALPAGVSYRFAGNYENQIRAMERLRIVLPMALFVIFLILYLQFRSTATTLIVFSGVFVAWAGGFLMLWLYGQDWFLDFQVFGTDMRELFQVHPLNLSVAVWVGFLALFGIATDDGVILSTYLKQSFARSSPTTREGIREAVVAAGLRRIRPCMMTTATTTLALIPVLTSDGRGADVMVPMAIPSFGGMMVVIITVFVVPTLFCSIQEWRLWWSQRDQKTTV